MKKFFLTVLVIAVVALMATAFVACDDYDPTMGGEGTNNYNRAVYTVTFRTTTQLQDITVKVNHGDKVARPKAENGEEIRPFKDGYTFVGWSATNNVNSLFNFDVDTITANTTLTAMFTQNQYQHTPDLTSKLVITKEGDDIRYSIQFDAYSDGDISLGANVKLSTTYNSNTNYLEKPTLSQELQDAGDEFLFWYYMADDVDEDGNKIPDGEGFRQHPVQFTQRIKEGDNSARIVETYKFTHSLTLYPMLKSNLPKIAVEFYSEAGGAAIATKDVPVGDKLYVEDVDVDPQKSGWTFGRWFYESVSEDENGDEVIEKVDFRFSEKADEATSKTEVVGTDIMDAAGVTDFFTPGTLKLQAKWIKNITLSSVADFENELYNKLHGSTELTEEEIDELLNANITITGDLDFSGKSYEPLFDSEHHFAGVIDGGTYNDEVVTAKITISNGTFGNKDHASVFGYVDGKIRNIVFENIGLNIADTDGVYVDKAYMAAIATENGGEIRNCEVRFDNLTVTGLNGVMFGGIAALNTGKSDSNDNGYIVACSVTFSGSFDVKELVFGGLTAEQNSRAVISEKSSANVTLSANCKRVLRIGGLAGNNNGRINRSTAQLNVTAAECPDEFVFGGICAVNTFGEVGRCSATATLCNDTAPAKVKGGLSQLVCIGGLIGRNEGTAINSYAVANLFVTVEEESQHGSILSVGGLVGSNYSGFQDKSNSSTSGVGAINYCYSTGTVNVKVTVKNTTVNVGGIAGRNNQSKLSRIFSDLEITVVNQAEGAVNKLGYLFGTMEANNGSSSSVGVNVYYAKDGKMTLNGEDYQRTEKRPDDAGDDYNPEYEETFPATTRGEGADKSNFTSEGFVVGDSSKLGFSDEVWQENEDALPTLKDA